MAAEGRSGMTRFLHWGKWETDLLVQYVAGDPLTLKAIDELALIIGRSKKAIKHKVRDDRAKAVRATGKARTKPNQRRCSCCREFFEPKTNLIFRCKSCKEAAAQFDCGEFSLTSSVRTVSFA
jgi:hypothetical protein